MPALKWVSVRTTQQFFSPNLEKGQEAVSTVLSSKNIAVRTLFATKLEIHHQLETEAVLISVVPRHIRQLQINELMFQNRCSTLHSYDQSIQLKSGQAELAHALSNDSSLMHLLHEEHLLLLYSTEAQHNEGSIQKRRQVSKPMPFSHYQIYLGQDLAHASYCSVSDCRWSMLSYPRLRYVEPQEKRAVV